MNIIVTGAAGYIGGQIALQLVDAGHLVTGIDRNALPKHLDGVIDFVRGDFSSDVAFKKIVEIRPDAVVHCAGTSLVAPSIKYPSDYYDNNMAKTMQLLNLLIHAVPCVRFIFSSSAAVYGAPIHYPCQEVDPKEPISPYGESKRMVEQMLASYHVAYNLDYVAFRYFNACGADPQGRHGQALGATHIMAQVLESVKNNTQFVCNGNKYETPDGTCVRDYVHVDDIARAHVIALSSAAVPSGVYNLGTSTGASNLEVVAAAQTAIGQCINVEFGPARAGDPDILTADAAKFRDATGWGPVYTLDDMAAHAWNWYNK